MRARNAQRIGDEGSSAFMRNAECGLTTGKYRYSRRNVSARSYLKCNSDEWVWIARSLARESCRSFKAQFAGSLRERCTRERRPLRPGANIEKHGIQWRRWLKKKTRSHARTVVHSRTHTRGTRDLRGCESIRTVREEEGGTERKCAREGGGWFILNMQRNTDATKPPRTTGAAREKISYRALINYTWFRF